jgi:hypothetical protein
MKKPEINIIENQRISDKVIELCHIPLKEDLSNIGESLNPWLSDFLPHFNILILVF